MSELPAPQPEPSGRLRVGSSCTGHGNLDLAVKLVLTSQLVRCTETDTHARTVLARHRPAVPNLGVLGNGVVAQQAAVALRLPDPFSVAATTGLAAVQLGRRHGIDITAGLHDEAIARIASHLPADEGEVGE